MSTSGATIGQVKQAMRAAWMAGDFGVIANTIAGDAETFIDRLRITPGVCALDVACGTGNLAIPLGKRGAVVTGVDIAPNLLVQARERAASAGLTIRFDEGDAEQLPYPDASFDLVVSMFGAMFAPRPALVAAELARVLRPGGRLAMANWNPEGFSGRMFAVNSRHVPSPPGVPPSVLWGDEGTVRERLQANFTEVETALMPIDFDLPAGAAGVVQFFRTYFGPTVVAFSRLDAAQGDALRTELEALWTSANVSPDPEQRTFVRNEYLQVIAVRR